jgi:hypothetical protein
MGRERKKDHRPYFVHSITFSDYSSYNFILSLTIFVVISDRLTTISLYTAHHHILICLALSCLVLSCLALPYFVLCYLALSFSVLFNHALLFICAI